MNNTEKQMERIADELHTLNITLKSIDETLAASWFPANNKGDI